MIGILLLDIKNLITRYGVRLITLTWLLLLAAFLVHMVLPRSVWYTYYSVEPVKGEFSLGEAVVFESSLTKKRVVSFEWLDALRCSPLSNPESTVLVSQYTSSSKNSLPEELRVTRWAYGAVLPHEPSVCFLETSVEVEVFPFVKKSQRLESSKFLIK